MKNRSFKYCENKVQDKDNAAYNIHFHHNFIGFLMPNHVSRTSYYVAKNHTDQKSEQSLARSYI